MEPTIGRVVIYRSRAGVDMPAIVTAVTDDPEYLHLHLFPPPGESADMLSHEWGTPRSDDDGEPVPQTWRWPERKS